MAKQSNECRWRHGSGRLAVDEPLCRHAQLHDDAAERSFPSDDGQSDCRGGKHCCHDLPASSLNGSINTLLSSNVMTTKITPELTNKLSYRYYDFKNDTPELLFAPAGCTTNCWISLDKPPLLKLRSEVCLSPTRSKTPARSWYGTRRANGRWALLTALSAILGRASLGLPPMRIPLKCLPIGSRQAGLRFGQAATSPTVVTTTTITMPTWRRFNFRGRETGQTGWFDPAYAGIDDRQSRALESKWCHSIWSCFQAS